MPRPRSTRLPQSRSSPSTPATSPRSAADLAKASGSEQGDRLGGWLDRFVREPEVLKLTGLSRTTRWRQAQRGEFPKPIRIGENATAWRLSEVVAWMDLRDMASRPTSQEAAQSGTEGDGR